MIKTGEDWDGLQADDTVLLKELCRDHLSNFCEVQNHLQIEESLKIIVNVIYIYTWQRRCHHAKINKTAWCNYIKTKQKNSSVNVHMKGLLKI